MVERPLATAISHLLVIPSAVFASGEFGSVDGFSHMVVGLQVSLNSHPVARHLLRVHFASVLLLALLATVALASGGASAAFRIQLPHAPSPSNSTASPSAEHLLAPTSPSSVADRRRAPTTSAGPPVSSAPACAERLQGFRRLQVRQSILRLPLPLRAAEHPWASGASVCTARP